MHDLTIAEIIDGLHNKAFSSVELTQHYLQRIDSLDSRYGTYITTTHDQALEQACQADQLLGSNNHTNNSLSPLCGVPLAQKDIFCTKGVRTSCGSKMLDNFVPPYDATVIESFNACGAVLLGKTNMDEFAMGSSNENSFYGVVRNPWDINYVPGGSSGGSAAAVAAHLAPAATGTDTGGSIRQPAAFCGVTGLKPTYGRVSRYGMIAFASSLDQGGPLTRNAEDAAILLQVMAGFDPRDSTSIDSPVPDYRASLGDSLAGLKIGIPQEYFSSDLNSELASSIQTALKELESLGATLIELSLPHTELAVPAYYVIAPAECSANLSRYDGVRYGYRCENPVDLDDLYSRSRSEAFGAEVKRRILVGTYALSAGYYDAYYRKAQQIRRLIKQDFVSAFEKVDIIAGPTSPSPAFKLGEKTSDPVKMYLEDIFTIPTSLAGLPGLSIPAGMVDNKPIGLQLIGNYFDEAKLLNVGFQFQQTTNWHLAKPPGIDN